MNGRISIAARLLLTVTLAGVVFGIRVDHKAGRSALMGSHVGPKAPAAQPPGSDLKATARTQADVPVLPVNHADDEPAVSPSAQAPSAPPGVPAETCPADMVLAEGSHCYSWEQPCVRWDDPEGQPLKRVCAEFQKPSVCKTNRHPMRFCMDRDEYIAPGETLPAKAVSWAQADMICTSAGKRLCTSLEWEFACEGEEGMPYPYGYERAPALCNQDRLLRDGKYKARADLREAPHPTCVSPFGVRDMVGNVDEWVRQPWAKAPHRSELRGGWWMTGRNRCRANTSHHDEKYAGPQTGFRCCKDTPSLNAQSGGSARVPRTAMVEASPD